MNTATDPRAAFRDAIDQQDIWKPGEMHSFAVALVAAAVGRLKNGQLKFSTDAVAEHDHPASPGVAGSVIEKLKNAHVIEPCGHLHEGVWCPDRVRSARETRKGAWICRYQLCSLAVANEFLRRNGREIAAKQLELTAV